MKKTYNERELKKLFYCLAYARYCFTAARDALEKLISLLGTMPEEELGKFFRPFMCYACVSYVNPFTQGRLKGKLPEEFASIPNEKLQKVHELLLSARHQFYAHTDATLSHHKFTIRAVCENGEVRYSTHIDVPNLYGPKNIIALCDYQNKRVDKLVNRLMGFFVLSNNLEERAIKAKGNAVEIEIKPD